MKKNGKSISMQNQLKLLFISIFVFSFINSFSQDYEFVKTNGTYYFGSQNAYRIDSVINSDTGQLLYSYRRVYTIVNDYEGVLDPLTSWLGDQVLVNNIGQTSFYNWSNHPFMLYSYYPVAEEWQAFKFDNGNYIGAHFNSSTKWTEIFSNLSDSVKTIQFQVYNSNHEAIDHYINEYEIRLSKNYGMLDALYYVGLDEDEPGLIYNYQISGIDLGDTIFGESFRFKEIISSLEINSSMHFTSYYESDDPDPHFIIRTVIDKRLTDNYCTYFYVDSILYQGNFSLKYNSVKWYIGALPYESMFPNDSSSFQGYMENSDMYSSTIWNNDYFAYHFWDGQNDTYNNEYAWFVDYWELNQANQYDYRFIENVGSLVVGKGNDWPGDELVYFRNSNNEWGEPLHIEAYYWSGKYQVLNKDFTLFFKQSPSWGPIRNLRAIRIDSIIPSSDLGSSKYYSYRTPESYTFNNENYLNPNTSWIGNYTSVSDTGTTTFYNQNGEAIIFNSGTTWGLSSWVMYEYANGSYIVATVGEEDSLQILPGLYDHIRNLHFQARNSNGSYMNHSINNKILRWSENYGLLDYFDFNIFPKIDAYYLIGMENDNESYGWHYNYSEIISSLSVGTDTHIQYEDSLFQNHEIIRKIASKIQDDNTVEYSFNICERIEAIDSTYVLNYSDTNIYVLNMLPRESILNPDYTGYQQVLSFGYVDTMDICGRREYYELLTTRNIETVEVNGKQLWRVDNNLYANNKPNIRFIEDIGLSTQLNYSEYANDTIVYFSSNSESCGTAFDFACTTNITELSKDIITIVPNPSNGYFALKNSSQKIKIIQVINSKGQLVWQENVNDSKKSFNASFLPSGLYLAKIYLENNQLIFQKLIINK